MKKSDPFFTTYERSIMTEEKVCSFTSNSPVYKLNLTRVCIKGEFSYLIRENRKQIHRTKILSDAIFYYRRIVYDHLLEEAHSLL